ncbi:MULTISPECIES: GNAT family N-acetyltransferase [Paraburkholderia]|jgi:CelD/BcsL family acetyltransferase involved in cellulose biosynthesis|uniref:Acetyltransferase involved in cellulose biosynthesis, CelD/BcsL family n=1 Tax=Paraburkholderia terricola TaxID=169427 RepID=A0A1M6MT52_9BURK|nr:MULTISPECIES: GNAT family N-acetyltransferase [Paraburkholderia]AXE96527.1 GNAT family N-acetyltransferase [Paraburkholderia terricola]ORC52476.1 GNAT family N-acetyltransferase [Burkholderia sp. A27]SDO04352.1 Acetyltransferase involved in cellulose biosynthesis, CelD/BcsL family [Paraburkholderia sediminicola]SHJ86715.1 Acetyltransferase involved in cellulose biosynthesis, CelD/BcsL family [Paraburkholderia terricola]
MQPAHAARTARRYEVIGDEAAFRALQHEWDVLWSRAHGHYYQSFSYCWLAWRHVSKPHGRRLKCIVCREGGQLVMIWPLETCRRALWTYLVPLGPEGGDYTSVLVRDGEAAPALIAGAWDTARRRCGADFIHLQYVRETLELYTLVSRERSVLFAEAHNAFAARLRGRGERNGWDDYCRTLGTLFGKRPGGFAKRLSREGKVAVRVVDPAEESETASIVEWMLNCKRSWSDRVGKRSAWLDSPEYECFLAKLIHSPDVPSMARLIVVTLNEAPVAAIIVSVGNPWASAIFAGYDPYYGRCCPGLVAVEACVKWAFDNGFDLDFGVGNERFKAYWSRGEASTAWTVRTVNSLWGLLAIRGWRLARYLGARVKGLREAGAASPEAARVFTRDGKRATRVS